MVENHQASCSLSASKISTSRHPSAGQSTPPFLSRTSCAMLQVLNLSPPLAVGLILVSCCPGGQVRNRFCVACTACVSCHASANLLHVSHDAHVSSA